MTSWTAILEWQSPCSTTRPGMTTTTCTRFPTRRPKGESSPAQSSSAAGERPSHSRSSAFPTRTTAHSCSYAAGCSAGTRASRSRAPRCSLLGSAWASARLAPGQIVRAATARNPLALDPPRGGIRCSRDRGRIDPLHSGQHTGGERARWSAGPGAVALPARSQSADGPRPLGHTRRPGFSRSPGRRSFLRPPRSPSALPPVDCRTVPVQTGAAMAKLAAPSGFRDFLPEQYRRRQELVRRIRESYEAFGFEGMDTPGIENLQVLLGKGGGENEKLMFRVLKRGADLERAVAAGRGELADLALRFDLTVPLARYYATHRAALPAVFKRYQIGPVWRAERAQYGRFREFIQCDVDVLGSASMAVEAEVILATTTALARLGFEGLVVRLNSRPLLVHLVRSPGGAEEQLGAAIIAIDKLDKETPDTVAAELTTREVPAPVVTALLEFHARSRATAEDALLAEVERRVGAAGAPLV